MHSYGKVFMPCHDLKIEMFEKCLILVFNFFTSDYWKTNIAGYSIFLHQIIGRQTLLDHATNCLIQLLNA